MLESLAKLRTGEDFQVSVETLDDVTFESDGSPTELLQTKHHIARSANLTDASPDLWRSIRIWIQRLVTGQITRGTKLFLITTAEIGDGSAAQYLLAGVSRSPEKAIERLNATAESSTNKANQPGHEAFRSLSLPEKEELVESVYVVGSSPSITDLDERLLQELRFAVDLEFLDSFASRLEGWWFRRVIRQLATDDLSFVLSDEILAEMSRLREQFKIDNLPIDDDILEATVDASGYQDRTFVDQLRLIGVGNKRIFYAIRSYFRAFEQRSRWIREDLLLVGDLSRYEARLIEEWELHFAQMRDELGKAATEELKQQAARKLYKWIETGEHPRIRPRCNEPFVSRGTYQMLADNAHVGWHPEFAERLRELLEATMS